MEIVINNQVISGNTEDIAKILEYLNPKRRAIAVQEPLSDVVKESVELRNKLNTNPNFNPFGGVVPGNEPLVSAPMQPTTQRAYAAETNTGIQYE
jgi:hypothetical protein